jgi:hypothetical protein
MEEVRNIMILLEYYKLELSLVMPKICLLIRKAQGKNKAKLMDKTKAVGKQNPFLTLINSPEDYLESAQGRDKRAGRQLQRVERERVRSQA